MKSLSDCIHIVSVVCPLNLCVWLGWANVLGSFQCRGILLLWHIIGQGPAVLVAGAGWVGFFFYVFFFSSHLSCLSFSNAASLGRRLDITEILWSRLL